MLSHAHFALKVKQIRCIWPNCYQNVMSSRHAVLAEIVMRLLSLSILHTYSIREARREGGQANTNNCSPRHSLSMRFWTLGRVISWLGSLIICKKIAPTRRWRLFGLFYMSSSSWHHGSRWCCSIIALAGATVSPLYPTWKPSMTGMLIKRW